MKIGVLGTGMVGEALATKFVQVGHEVMMGSRTADNETASKWVANTGERASQGTFADAAAFGEVNVNATGGEHSLDALKLAGATNLDGKVLIDVANLINHADSGVTIGLPDGDSLGERIQREFPNTKVVKTFNTMSAPIMVEPSLLGDTHVNFVSGNDADAKQQVGMLLSDFGWTPEQIVDLGDITNCRGTELYLALWLRIMQSTGTFQFNVSINR